MKNIILYSLIFCFCLCCRVFADQYVPDFGSMRILRCEVSETTYNAGNSEVSKTNYHRIIRFDDENKKIYIQKEQVLNIKDLGNNTFKFYTQTMTDDSVITSEIQVNRDTLEYLSSSEIVYDNAAFGVYSAKAKGECKVLN